MGRSLTRWEPDDARFWSETGKRVAWRNLMISIPALLCGFGVWMMWSILSVQMLHLGFPFSSQELFTLTAIAGLSGATLRIPATFLIRLCGGGHTVLLTTLLLLFPAVGAALALQSTDTPLWVFQGLALLSGLGGGNFASSMSNISAFFPKRMQGLALGLNGGLGNLGITVMQFVTPLAMTAAVFGGAGMVLQKASGTPVGQIAAGTLAHPQNAGWMWVAAIVPLLFAVRWGMNNLGVSSVTPRVPPLSEAGVIIVKLLGVGVVMSAVGLWLMLPESGGGASVTISKWIVVPAVAAATVLAMRFVLPRHAQEGLRHQYGIFRNGHTWVMTLIYTMTFGSFIGFSAVLPLAITIIFGFSHVPDAGGVMTHTTVNGQGPSAFVYAWIGPFVGAVARPVGGWLADRWGGAAVTQLCSVAMVAGAVAGGYYLSLAYGSATPEAYFPVTLSIFIVLFLASGLGNGSTFRTIGVVFNRERAGPVLGWTSAVAAYGAFLIPQILGEEIKRGEPAHAMYGFAVFYLVCLALNGWVYLRPGARHFNA